MTITVLLVLALIMGFYVAWNIGANDVANAMGTSVGSGALTLRNAVILAAILEFAGAFFLGSHVSETIETGVVNPAYFVDTPLVYALGMLGSLLAVGVWLQTASYFGWPVSTTHSIVGALLGFGIIVVGPLAIDWGTILAIISSWVTSPFIGGVLGFVTFSQIRKRIFYSPTPVTAAKKITPYFVFATFCILLLVVLFQRDWFTFWTALGLAILLSLVAATVAHFLVARVQLPQEEESRAADPQLSIGLERAMKHLRRAVASSTGEMEDKVTTLFEKAQDLYSQTKQPPPYEALHASSRTIERIFAYLQIMSACFMAFAHGANDVANAMGPLSGVIAVLQNGQIRQVTGIPTWILTLGGVGIVIGLATWGWRVIATIGSKITELTPTRGFAAEFGAATTIVVASRLGLPISTTHTIVGAVFGVGLARGLHAINLNVMRDIVISWVVTIPAGALLAVLFYELLKLIFL